MPDPTVHRAYACLRDGQVHFAECGPPQGQAVLLLHQTPRSWAEYAAVLPILGARYRAIAMDTAGFGDSFVPRWTPSIERWAAVAVELLDALSIARVHVVGHHTGGVIALELAAAYPGRVDRLVLSSTPFTDAAFRRERAARPPIDEVATQADGSHLAQLWQRRQPFYPQQRPELLAAFVLDALKAGGRLEDGHRAVARYRMEDRIAHVKQPVLVLRAGADPFASPHAQALCAQLPQAALHDIPHGMVPLPDQLPGEFAAAVLAFLDLAR